MAKKNSGLKTAIADALVACEDFMYSREVYEAVSNAESIGEVNRIMLKAAHSIPDEPVLKRYEDRV